MMRFSGSSFLILWLVLVGTALPLHAAYDTGAANTAKTLQIIKVTPEGEDVPAGKQLVITFNRPVVPIGKMERASSDIPVIITPALACEWRWINTSALACNLPDKQPMQLATNYTVEIKPGIKAEDGTTIEKAEEHHFITQRPDIRYKDFRVWKSPSLPVIRLTFNQPVDKTSVEQHIFLAIGESEKRIAIKASPDPEDRDQPTIMPVPGDNYALAFKKQPAQKSDDQPMHRAGGEARRVWLVEPPSELPLDTRVVLKSEAGLLSALGPEPGIETSDVVSFATYPEFKFVGMNCQDNAGNYIFMPADKTPDAKCNPMRPVNLSFSAPVDRKLISRAVAFTPAIGWKAQDDSEEDAQESEEPSEGTIGYQFRQTHEKGRTYNVFLPFGLKAAQTYTLHTRLSTLNPWQLIQYWIAALTKPSARLDIADIFGRKLKTIAGTFVTDHRTPNYVLDYRDAILEKGVDSEVPFFVNNINNYTFTYRSVTQQGAAQNQSFKRMVPDVKDTQFAVPLGIRDMLKNQSGVVFGYLQTSPELPNSIAPRLFSQVTPFQVHLKLGHFSSLLWVTDFATGQAVQGARVTIYKDAFTTLQPVKQAVVTATTDTLGIAQFQGTDLLDPDLSITDRWKDEDERYFVKIEKGEDMALLPVSSSFAINTYRASGSEDVYPWPKKHGGHIRAWGTTAQGIYRAGDTIQYKIYLRNQDNTHFVPPPKQIYALRIIDPTGKVVHTVKNIGLSAFGGTAGEFTVPKEAAVGWYRFKLSVAYAADGTAEPVATENEGEGEDEEASDDGSSWVAMRVLVSDFTPAPFHVSNQLNGDLFRADDKVNVTTRAELHSGGAYSDASARITAILDSGTFKSKDPVAKDFQFDSYAGETPTQQVFQKIDKVGDKGELALDFQVGNPNIVYGKLTVESAVADERGKYVSGAAQADYVGVDRLVGLKSTDWLFTVGKPATVQYIVVDEKGAPAKGTPVNIVIEHQVTKAARVKGAGNAYLTEYHQEWEQAGTCTGTSAQEAQPCSFTPQKSGSYRLTASIKDTKNHPHATALASYAVGKDVVLWDDGNESSLDIIPEHTDVKVGDTARYLVKNPYPGAKALITVERYGVIDHFVKTLDSSTSVISLKIEPDYLPGFYLSVVVFSPRVEKPLGQGQVDLGKPTFRMGYVSVPVKDPAKEMVITARTDRDVYKPREKVTLTLHAQPRMKDKKEPIELAVAVLDESVFDLITGGKTNFDPYTGFYKLEKLDLRNYSLLTRLVGRQKFEKKGANPGGDGGADLSMRSVFKFVSYWNGELQTDASGNATATFEAPDNLTGWRVLAIATTPTDRFGLGDANFKVNRPTEIRPIMPNQLLERDTFNAGFSVMNRTGLPRTIKVKMHVDGPIDATTSDKEETITLEPYKRAIVSMPVQTASLPLEREKTSEKLTFTVSAGDDTDQDQVMHSVDVYKARSLEVAANYGTTTQDHAQESIAFPKDILPDTGSVSVVAAPSVIGNVAGAFSYMRDYPYMCWEQKLSKAVMASHYKNLKSYLPDTLKWADADKLTQTTLDQAASFQAPNGGMGYFVAQDSYADPYLSAYTALAFNWLRNSGYRIPDQVEVGLHSYLSNLLKNNAVPDFYSEGMTSTIRAVALAALAERGKADLADLERYWPHVKKMSLFGKSYFLQATLAVKGGEKYAPDVAKMILAMSNETGGTYVFNETWDDSYSRILASPLREQCVVLSAFTAYGERPGGFDLVGDVPFKLVRTITQTRKNRDHWENTQENLFCMNALIDFARIYEKDKPAFTVKASLGDEAMGEANFKDVRDAAQTLERPIKAGDEGRNVTLNIDRTGTGRLYYSTRLAYALPLAQSKGANAGIEIHREYSVERNGAWQLLKSPYAITRGELVRVDLYISLPAARNFVVVDDPVPGGLEPVNRELATASQVDARKGDFQASGGSFWFKYSDWVDFGVSRWAFYHQELRNNAVRFYSDYLSPGNYHLSYTAQAVATGTFSILPSQTSEMYDPDVYGKTEGTSLNVTEQDAKPHATY